MRLGLIVGLLGALAAASPALAQPAQPASPAQPACAAMDANLPAELAGWTQRVAVTAAGRTQDLPQAALTPGQAATVTLHPTGEVAYLTQPERPGGSAAHGGLLSLTITEAATYRLVISSGAWIDVLRDGQPLVSSAHAPGPACSTARKTVEFILEPGAYVIQLSANADPTIGVLVLRRP